MNLEQSFLVAAGDERIKCPNWGEAMVAVFNLVTKQTIGEPNIVVFEAATLKLRFSVEVTWESNGYSSGKFAFSPM